MSEYKKIVLTGKGYYFNLRTPNELSGKYQVDLSIDDLTAEKLQTIGITIKNKGDDRQNYITLISSTKNKDGSPRQPIPVVDKNEQPLDDSILIGYGSKVKVLAKPFDWHYKPTNKKGTSIGIEALQVLDLVPYVPKPKEGGLFGE